MTRAAWWKEKANVSDCDIADDIRSSLVYCWNLMKLRGMIPENFSESSDCKNDSGEWESDLVSWKTNSKAKATEVFSPT